MRDLEGLTDEQAAQVLALTNPLMVTLATRQHAVSLHLLKLVGLVGGTGALYGTLLALAQVGLTEQAEAAGCCPDGAHRFAVEPPDGLTVEQLRPGPLGAVRFLAAAGNGDDDTAAALFAALVDGASYQQVAEFMATAVAGLADAWAAIAQARAGR